MTNTLTDFMQMILVQQVAFINSAQNQYQNSRRAKDARIITELIAGLSALPETISSMNALGVSNIDVESIKVFISKLELEDNFNAEPPVEELENEG